MKFLKFLFTARMSFILFALLAFVFTVLYVTWVNRHQGPVLVHHDRSSQSR